MSDSASALPAEKNQALTALQVITGVGWVGGIIITVIGVALNFGNTSALR